MGDLPERGNTGMKVSFYNLLLPESNAQYCLLYNTLSGAMIKFEKNLMGEVENILSMPLSLTSIQQLRDEFIRQRFLIADSVDELNILRQRRQQGIEDKNRYDIVIMMTQDCNFACRYCYERHKKSLMDQTTTESVLRWLSTIIPKVKILYFSFFGGEPLLAKKGMVTVAKRVYQLCQESGTGLLGNVTTNGYLLDESIASQLISNGFDNFQITIDGPPEHHDMLRPQRNGKGSFKRVFQNTLRLLRQLKDRSITIRSNFNAGNLSTIPELYEMIPVQYRSRVRVSLEPIFRSGKLDAGYALTETEIGEKMAEVYRQAEKMGFQVPDGTSGLGKLTYCFAERRQQAVVNYNGDVFKCSTCDFEKENRVGFISEDGEFVKEELFDKWIPDEFFSDNCQECKLLPLCMGGCRLHYLNEGTSGSSCGLIPTNASLPLKWTAYKRLEDALSRQCSKLSVT